MKVQLAEAKVMVQPCGMGEIGTVFVLGFECLSFKIIKTSLLSNISYILNKKGSF